MPKPNDSILPDGVELRDENGEVFLSPALSELFVVARSEYDWPAGTGAAKSQKNVIGLEADVAACMVELSSDDAHFIISEVSKWAGNNAKSHSVIVNADEDTKETLRNALNLLCTPTAQSEGLDALSELPGINLVIASKIFRYTCPHIAASVDRHASYFFNSLEVVSPIGESRKATSFKREWTTGCHSYSRLATYTQGYYKYNRQHYVGVYLPLLASIAANLNRSHMLYSCAETVEKKVWRPTDVEMAAYYWWATNGAR